MTSTLADLEKAVAALAPAITDRAADIERARRLPSDVLDELVTAGCFRVLVSAARGGIGADLPAALRVFEHLAAADGATGWTVMIGAANWCDLAGLPRDSFDALFANGPDTIMAGAFNPSGSITPIDGGYRVNGRWSFASGCEHASWLWGNCIEGFVDGAPQMRIAVFTRDEAEIEDTWDVIGLSGTGSHHFRVDDVTVPADRTFVPFVSEPCIDDPIVRVPAPALYSQAIASVAVGIARGALDDIVSLSSVKVPLLAQGTLATNELFHHQLATADTELRAARALLHESAAALWECAVAGAPPSVALRARSRAAAAWVVERAVAVVTTAYRHGGGSAVYAASPLQRRLRDVNALSQHFLVRPDTMTTAGAVFAGNELTATVF